MTRIIWCSWFDQSDEKLRQNTENTELFEATRGIDTMLVINAKQLAIMLIFRRETLEILSILYSLAICVSLADRQES